MQYSFDRCGKTAEMLRGLFEATASATGEDFFRVLVRHLASSLNVRVTLIAEYFTDHKRARTLAIWDNDQYLDNVEYPVEKTPCEAVLQGEIVQIREGLQKLYPGEGFSGVKAESYLGIPLIGANGDVIGHVVALDNKPMPEADHDFTVLETFAVRATAELERFLVEEKLAMARARLILAERQAALGQLTAGIAHEINSPLGVIKSNAQLTTRSVHRILKRLDESSPLDNSFFSDTRSLVNALLTAADDTSNAGQRISEVIANLKKFTRIDESAYQEYDIREGLQSALGLLRPSLKARIAIITAFDPVPKIRCQPAAINEVFMTLLKNAGEAIEQKGAIHVATLSHDSRVEIKIVDEGKGIPGDQLARVFDLGLRPKGSRVGLRMGLANARNIITAHGGDIDLQSKVGVGTEVSIRLPVNQALAS